MKGSKPVMTGRIAMHSSIVIPPGDAKVTDRLRLDGRFALEQTQFTDPEVREQIATLSKRSRGKDKDAPSGKVSSNMRGRFVLRDGVIRFDPVGFNVPGAEVELRGRYGLRSEQLDFNGTLAMQASISDAMGGIKGFFLKPFNPIFRTKGKGAVVPISISGPREKPKFGVDWGKVFK